MDPKSLRSAIQLAARLKHVFVATADSSGTPHLAAAAELSRVSENRVAVAAWFCPATLENLKKNKRIALIVWDASDDHGFQLSGRVEHIEELAILDGFAPEIEAAAPLPQVERKLLVDVEKIVGFSHAPHSDTEDELET